jgi:hypothetical protein
MTVSIEALQRIAALEQALRPEATLSEAQGWWSMVESIETGLLGPKFDSTERERMRRLRETVSDAILMIREKRPSPDLTMARVALASLRIEVERKTTWP